MKAVQIVFLASILLLGGGAAQAATPMVPFKHYYYNYLHQVPPDYVYRTDRLFFPPNGPPAATSPAQKSPPPDGRAFRRRIRKLAKQLLAHASEEIADQYKVAVSTFVNLNNLYRTSALGRYLSEQLMGELQTAGIDVIDLRRTPSIMVSRTHGVYALSRDMDELSFVHSAQATLVGTYTVAAKQLFINARLLRNRDSRVLASASLMLPLNPLLRSLLADESAPVGPGTKVKIGAYPGNGSGA